MSTTAMTPSADARHAGDSFAMGVLVMLAVNILQRCVGLLRGLGFCHFLTDVELGQWALANSFFVIAVPIAVLGLPGSFGKFVEYFRHRGQLGDYLSRVVTFSLAGLLLTASVIGLFPGSFSWLVFRQSSPGSVVLWCVIAFICITVFSFVSELVASLRQVRAVSVMQFAQSLVFAIVGLSLVAAYRSWTVLLPSFAIACVLAILPGLWVLRSQYREEFVPSGTVEGRKFWMRIVPYAAALWFMNFLSNMFEVGDRYMLLHLLPGGYEAGQAVVGQYHCGRILPNLLVSVALMLGGVLLPYLSADWEAGRQDRIAARLRQMVQSVCVGFMALSVAAMVVAPLLFDMGFGNRYQQAEAILPMALLQAIWAGLFLIAEAYMLCAERGKQLAALLVVGLAINLGLNWWMIQSFGLPGAVAATSAANLVTLLLLFWRMSRCGCSLGPGTVWLCFAPLAVPAGPVVTMLALVVIVFLAGRTEWLLSQVDRQQIDEAVLGKLKRYGIRLRSLWP